MVSLSIEYKVEKNGSYKEGDNPFEQMKCIVIFKFDEKLDIDDKKGIVFNGYKIEQYTFFELDSYLRQSLELDYVISNFLEKHNMEYFFDEESLEEAVIHMVNGSGGGISLTVPNEE